MGEMVQTAYLDIFPPPFVVIASAHSALGVFPAFVIDITANGHTLSSTSQKTPSSSMSHHDARRCHHDAYHPQIKRNATRINIIKSAKWEGCERYLNAIILKCFKSCYLKRRFANVEYISVSTIDLLGHLILINKVTKPRSKIFNTGGEIARLSQQL